jgi:hypothetical protein
VADKSSQLVLNALHRAAAEPGGMPLFSQKTASGLFAGTSLAKQAAKRCLEEELLGVVRLEPRGKSSQEFAAITPKGLHYLLSQSSPREVLEDFVRALEARDQQLAEMQAAIMQAQESLAALRGLAAVVLQQWPRHSVPLKAQSLAADHECAALIKTELKRWRDSLAPGDCPLPHLYGQVACFTTGQFHDALRLLIAQESI